MNTLHFELLFKNSQMPKDFISHRIFGLKNKNKKLLYLNLKGTHMICN
jgi:hypothetical protein